MPDDFLPISRVLGLLPEPLRCWQLLRRQQARHFAQADDRAARRILAIFRFLSRQDSRHLPPGARNPRI